MTEAEKILEKINQDNIKLYLTILLNKHQKNKQDEVNIKRLVKLRKGYIG